jgi:RNA polymerase sigma-70 factor (ECF subfamily)
MAEPTDELALLRRWQGGDAAAGRRFVAHHLPSVARFFASKVPQAHDADDLTARTFEVLVGKLASYRGDGSPRTFLFAIAHHVLLGWVRDKQRADARFELGSISAAALGPSTTTLVHARRQQRLLLDGLRALPMDAQVMLELSVFEDMSRAEIAEVVGLPAGTVAHRLRRAKELLAIEIASRAESSALAATTTADLDAWARELRAALVPGSTHGE